MSNTITFVCREKDELLEIQLEREALLVKVSPRNEMTFEGNASTGDFKWAMRFDWNGLSIQA